MSSNHVNDTFIPEPKTKIMYIRPLNEMCGFFLFLGIGLEQWSSRKSYVILKEWLWSFSFL